MVDECSSDDVHPVWSVENVLDRGDKTVCVAGVVVAKQVQPLKLAKGTHAAYVKIRNLAVIKPHRDEPWLIGGAELDLTYRKVQFFTLKASVLADALTRKAREKD